MADITQLRYAQLLKRLFGVKTSDPGRALSPVVSPSYDVQDNYQPEQRALRGEKNFSVNSQASNVAANFNAMFFQNPSGSGRLTVVKRVTWTFAMPTAANQPGNLFAFVQVLNPGGTLGTLVPNVKDARFGLLSAGVGVISSRLLVAPQGVIFGGFPASIWAAQVFPGAAVSPQFVQVDNLDVVLAPGSQTAVFLMSDVLPVATWTWHAHIEGFERIIDPAELIVGA